MDILFSTPTSTRYSADYGGAAPTGLKEVKITFTFDNDIQDAPKTPMMPAPSGEDGYLTPENGPNERTSDTSKGLTDSACKCHHGNDGGPATDWGKTEPDIGLIKNLLITLLDALGLGNLADQLFGRSKYREANSPVDQIGDVSPVDDNAPPTDDAAPPAHSAAAPTGGATSPTDSSAGSANAKTYTIQEGDTTGKIAEKLHVTIGSLMKANPDKIPNADKIKAGDVLVVPDSSMKDQISSDFDTHAQKEPLTPEQTKQTADRWVNHLQNDLGLTHAQAVGVVANLSHESWGMNPGIMQGGEIGDPTQQSEKGVNATGFGICQWGEDRRQGLIDYAKLNGLPVTSEAAQYGYIREELQTQFKPHLDLIKGVQGEGPEAAKESAKLFAGGGASLPLPNGVRGYLAPSDPQVEKRLMWVGSDGNITIPANRGTDIARNDQPDV